MSWLLAVNGQPLGTPCSGSGQPFLTTLQRLHVPGKREMQWKGGGCLFCAAVVHLAPCCERSVAADSLFRERSAFRGNTAAPVRRKRKEWVLAPCFERSVASDSLFRERSAFCPLKSEVGGLGPNQDHRLSFSALDPAASIMMMTFPFSPTDRRSCRSLPAEHRAEVGDPISLKVAPVHDPPRFIPWKPKCPWRHARSRGVESRQFFSSIAVLPRSSKRVAISLCPWQHER